MPDWGWFHKAFGRSFKSFHTNKFTTFLYFSYVQLFAMLFFCGCSELRNVHRVHNIHISSFVRYECIMKSALAPV